MHFLKRFLFALSLLSLLAIEPALASCTGQFQAGQVCANATGSAAEPRATSTPILGRPGVTAGTLGFAGVGSGTVTITPQSAAGTPTLLLPNSSGTFVVSASSPLVLNAVTGNLTCPDCMAAGGGGTSEIDEAAFVAGTTLYTPIGGFFQTTATNNALTNGQGGWAQMTAQRALFTNLRNASGTEIGVAGAELFVGGRGTAGSAAGGVLSVQGVASMTPLLATGTGTAGTAATGVVTVQGIASMTALTVAQATAANLNATVIGAGSAGTANAGVVTVQGIASMTPLLVNPGTAANFGVQTQGSTTSGQSGNLAQGAVTTAAPTYTTAQTSPLSLTTTGALRVAVTSGGGTGGTSSNFGDPFPAIGTAVGMSVSGNMVALTGTSGNLNVQCANCSGSGASAVDEAAFTAGADVFAPAGGFFQTTATNNALTNGQQGMWQMTATRAGFVNLRNASGAEIGVAGAELFVGGRGTAGSAAGGVLSIQGVGSGTPVPVSGTVTAANASVSATGAAVPASATYAGINVGGNLTGWTGAVTVASGGIASGAIASGAVASGAVASGAYASGALASGSIASGAMVDLVALSTPIAPNTATATKGILIGGQYDSTQKTLTNGQQGGVSLSARGAVMVAVGADGFTVTSTVASVGATGSAVPASANFAGLSDGTNLRGWLNAANALNSTGAGIGTAQVVGQCDDTSPTALTENQFGNARIDCTAHTLAVGGLVTTAAPSYSDSTARGLSLTTAGGLRTDLATVAGTAVAAGNGAASAAQRVTLANDSTGIVQTVPGTAGGLSVATFNAAASDNHAVAKAGAGQVYHISGFNTNAAANYIRLYNATTGFNGCNSATNLVWSGIIPGNTAGSGFVVPVPEGIAFATGISYCVTGAFGNTDTTNAVTPSSINIGYK